MGLSIPINVMASLSRRRVDRGGGHGEGACQTSDEHEGEAQGEREVTGGAMWLVRERAVLAHGVVRESNFIFAAARGVRATSERLWTKRKLACLAT